MNIVTYAKSCRWQLFRYKKANHQKCPGARSEIVSGRQGLKQAWTLARRHHKKAAALYNAAATYFTTQISLQNTLQDLQS